MAVRWTTELRPAPDHAAMGTPLPASYRLTATFGHASDGLAPRANPAQDQAMAPDEVALVVEGWPPAKNEAKSMLSAGHPYADRVLHLLQAVKEAVGNDRSPALGGDALGLELIVYSPVEPPSDATNYLGGVSDVLEAKDRRGVLPHLGELADIALFLNDRQIHEVVYRWVRGSQTRYAVRLWKL